MIEILLFQLIILSFLINSLFLLLKSFYKLLLMALLY